MFSVSAKRLHLLVLLPASPLPIFTGGRLRTYQILKGVAQNHDVTVLCFGRDEGERTGLAQLAEELNIEVVPVPYAGLRGSNMPQTLARRLWKRLRGLPADVAIWEQSAMHDALKRVLADNPIDLIQVEFPYLTPYALAHPHIPRLLITFDIYSIAFARRAALATGFLQRAALRRQAKAWQRYESAIYPQYGAVGVMSENDAAIARNRAPAANIIVLPNGVDTEALTPGEIRPQARNLLFVGSPTHEPNLDAACWLLTEIWPDLHKKRPDLTLTLVNLDHPRLQACIQPGVEITGRLPDITPLYRRADLVIVPLRAGSGTRLKILEAFALGVPVVSTTVGHEGLKVEPGKHLLAADSAQAINTAILQLLDAPEQRKKLAENARQLVVEHYDWETITLLHEKALTNILDGADFDIS